MPANKQLDAKRNRLSVVWGGERDGSARRHVRGETTEEEIKPNQLRLKVPQKRNDRPCFRWAGEKRFIAPSLSRERKLIAQQPSMCTGMCRGSYQVV